MTTAVAEAQDAHDEHHGPEKGIRRWLFTTNHKEAARWRWSYAVS
jgi:cytochrome c oxidase subunit 1